MKTSRTLPVQWTAAEREAVAVISTTGLKVRAADRLVQFVRNNPNLARYSAENDPRRGKPVLVLG